MGARRENNSGKSLSEALSEALSKRPRPAAGEREERASLNFESAPCEPTRLDKASDKASDKGLAPPKQLEILRPALLL